MFEWGAVIAAAAAIASAQQQAAADEQRRQFAQHSQDLSLWTGFSLSPAPKHYDPGKPCQGCGSRETLIHRGARKCAYCRSDR
jgi:hypothetical protein